MIKVSNPTYDNQGSQNTDYTARCFMFSRQLRRNRQYGGPANTTSRRSQFGKANVEYFKHSLVEGGVKNIKCIVMSFRVGS